MEELSRELKTWTIILRASQAIQDIIRQDVARYGLNPTEFSVLELLYHRGEQPIQTIGKKTLISSGSTTYVVDKLEDKKYLKRTASPEDRRVIYAALTESGQELMERIFPPHEVLIQEVFEELLEEEKLTVQELMKKIGYRAKDLSKNCPKPKEKIGGIDHE